MMPLHRLLTCVGVCAALLHTRVVQAQIPTTDVANIVQTTKSAFESIEQTRSAVAQEFQGVEQLFRQAEQIRRQIEQIENMNGNYLKHMLLNDAQYRRARRLIPATYQDMHELYQDSEDKLIATGFTKPDAARATDAMIAVIVGDVGMARADDLITESEALMAEIDTDMEQKAALDLANRMAAQNQLMLAELLRVQSLQLSAGGRQQLHDQTQRAVDTQTATFRGFRKLTGQ